MHCYDENAWCTNWYMKLFMHYMCCMFFVFFFQTFAPLLFDQSELRNKELIIKVNQAQMNVSKAIER